LNLWDCRGRGDIYGEKRKSRIQETKKMFIAKNATTINSFFFFLKKTYNNMFFRDRLCWHVYSLGFSIIISMWCILIAHSFVGFYPSLG